MLVLNVHFEQMSILKIKGIGLGITYFQNYSKSDKEDVLQSVVATSQLIDPKLNINADLGANKFEIKTHATAVNVYPGQLSWIHNVSIFNILTSNLAYILSYNCSFPCKLNDAEIISTPYFIIDKRRIASKESWAKEEYLFKDEVVTGTSTFTSIYLLPWKTGQSTFSICITVLRLARVWYLQLYWSFTVG